MRRKRVGIRVLVAGAGICATAVAASGVTKASAATGSTPRAYRIVESAVFTAPKNADSFGHVTCPPTKSGVTRRPQSGGVRFDSTSLAANLGDSYPMSDGVSWGAHVNNTSTSDATFTVWAVCAKPKRGYVQVESAAVANGAHHQDTGLAQCPVGTKVLGGGARSLSAAATTSLNQDMNSSYPTTDGSTYGWQVAMNNGGSSSLSFNVWVICSNYSVSKTGYFLLRADPLVNHAGTQMSIGATCPSGLSILGGGVYSSATSTNVNINSTYPATSTTWQNVENNADSSDHALAPAMICAG